MYYNGERVFEANPQNGRVYFGNNFWYDPATKSIRTPNDKTVINADGTIEATDGNFSGVVNASSGSFAGSIETNELVVGDTYYSAGDTFFYGLTDDGIGLVNSKYSFVISTLSSGSVRIKAQLKANYYSSSFYAYPSLTIKKNGTSVYTTGNITNSSTYTNISQDVFLFN